MDTGNEPKRRPGLWANLLWESLGGVFLQRLDDRTYRAKIINFARDDRGYFQLECADREVNPKGETSWFPCDDQLFLLSDYANPRQSPPRIEVNTLACGKITIFAPGTYDPYLDA